MARDFRHGPRPKFEFQRRSQQMLAEQEDRGRRKLPFTGKIGLFFLALVTAFLVISHFVNQFKQLSTKDPEVNQVYQPDAKQALEPPKQEVIESPEAAEQPPVSALVEPLNYRFYTELPHMEVVVDVEPLPISLPEPMWIQAGSFRDLAQAEREQRRLSSDDRQMLISPIETANGVFYRMMLGPFTDRLLLNQQRNALRRMGADTRVVKPPATLMTVE